MEQHIREAKRQIDQAREALEKGNLSTAARSELIEHIKELLAISAELEKRFYNRHFYLFNKDVLGWPDIYEPLHKQVCDFIQDNIETKMCLVLIPRGCFKSSVVTVGYSAWEIGKNPNTRGLIANSTYPMATSFLGQVKNILEFNTEFKRLYGDLAANAPTWKDDAFTVNAKDVTLSKETTLTAAGVKSNYTGKHFDWAILDDVVNRDNVRTIDRMEEVKNFYRDTLDLVDPSPTGHKKVVVVGTTWHQGDLYSWIMDPENGVRDQFAVLRLPAYGYFDNNNKFIGNWGKDKLLFPTRLTWDVLKNLKTSSQDASHFSAQYLLDPVPPDNADFKNFKFYDKENLRGIDMYKFMAVDPALSDDKSADYSAIVVVGVDSDNTWYILDLWRDQVKPKALIEQIFIMDQKHRPRKVAIESTGFQRTIQYSLSDEMRLRGHKIPLEPLKHVDRSKEERIRALQPRYEAGLIFHDKSHPFERFLRDELERFPRGKNDDLADALAAILEIAYPPKAFRHRKSSSSSSYYPA